MIESCLHNKEFVDAELYARTTFETITLSRDSHIPDDRRQYFTAEGAYFLALAMYELARNGDIPPEANQAAGQEAIALARRALEIFTQLLHGLEHDDVANSMIVLARALDYFNNVDDDEVLRLYEQSIAITARVEGSSTVNVGQVRRIWPLRITTKQRGHTLPMIWTGSWLIWSWRCPTIVKRLGSTGPPITWTGLMKLHDVWFKSRRHCDSSELPEQQRLGAE